SQRLNEWSRSLGPTLRVAACVEELRPILEVHGVVVEPAAAPDEAFGFESVDNRLRDAIAPAGWFLPAPVIRVRDVDVDRDAPRVRARAIGAGDGTFDDGSAELV